MSNGKVKVYKNPDRSKANNFKPYVPQYQVLGVEPEEFKSAVVPSNYPSVQPNEDNPRVRPQAPIRQNYANNTPSPIGRGLGPIPNVGNNVEHTWSGVDEEIVDDMGDVDPNHPMIDNNEYVSEEALGRPTTATQSLHSYMEEVTARAPRTEQDDLIPILQVLEEVSYLLLANVIAVCSGPLEDIQEQASALVFGEHDLCAGNPIPVEDIVILKRAVIKFGLFLD